MSSSAYGFETNVEGFDVNYNIDKKGQICVTKVSYDGSLPEKYDFKSLQIKFKDCYGNMEFAIANGEEVGFLGRLAYANKIRKQYKKLQTRIEEDSQIALK